MDDQTPCLSPSEPAWKMDKLCMATAPGSAVQTPNSSWVVKLQYGANCLVNFCCFLASNSVFGVSILAVSGKFEVPLFFLIPSSTTQAPSRLDIRPPGLGLRWYSCRKPPIARRKPSDTHVHGSKIISQTLCFFVIINGNRWWYVRSL